MSTADSDSVSVIMPCYNAEATLDRSIDSVLSQTHRNLELIVVDDGSTDHTLHKLKAISDPRVRLVDTDHAGVCRARNTALDLATGRFIAFLDADDRWDPTFLEKLLQRLTLDPDSVLAYCGWQNVGLKGKMGEPYIPPELEHENKAEVLLRTCPWPIHAVLTRREAIRQAGGFDPRFSIGEDFLLWLSIASIRPISRVPEVLAYYYHHTGPRATTNKDKVAIGTWLVQRTFLAEHPEKLESADVKRIQRIPNQCLLSRGFECYWQGELGQARNIFRLVMRQGYGRPKDWLYMLPSWLPLPLHNGLLKVARMLS